MNKEQRYNEICQKLECKPTEIEIPDFEIEDDSWVSPVSKLSVDEIDFLYENGYLNKQ